MNANERLAVEFCWCGIEHAIPTNLSSMSREKGYEVYCPLGHKWHIKKSENQKLTEEVGSMKYELSEANAEVQRLERKVRRLEKKKKK